MLGACPRLEGSTADALDVARSSDPFRGRLKKAASLGQGYGRQASCVPCLRRSGFAQAGSGFWRAHVLRVRSARQAYSAEVAFGYEGREALRPCWTAFLNIPRFR